MKLCELQTIQPNSLTPKKTNLEPEEMRAKLQPKNGVRLGDGLYADAYSTKEEPGTVTKVVRSAGDLKSDAYFQYVSAIAKNDRISNNPYFPRIFNVKVRETGQGKQIYSVEMERLLPFDTLSAEEMQMLADRLFFNWQGFAKDAVARMKEIHRGRISQDDLDRIKPTSKSALAFGLIKAMSTIIDRGAEVQTYIKDPKLRAALTILKSLIKNNAVYLDLHDQNIMVRRGPGGPQLVITDPVSG